MSFFGLRAGLPAKRERNPPTLVYNRDPRNEKCEPIPKPSRLVQVPKALVNALEPIIAHYFKSEQTVQLKTFPHQHFAPAPWSITALALEWFTEILLQGKSISNALPRIPNPRCPQCGSDKIECFTCKRIYRVKPIKRTKLYKPRQKKE